MRRCYVIYNRLTGHYGPSFFTLWGARFWLNRRPVFGPLVEIRKGF